MEPHMATTKILHGDDGLTFDSDDDQPEWMTAKTEVDLPCTTKIDTSRCVERNIVHPSIFEELDESDEEYNDGIEARGSQHSLRLCLELAKHCSDQMNHCGLNSTYLLAKKVR